MKLTEDFANTGVRETKDLVRVHSSLSSSRAVVRRQLFELAKLFFHVPAASGELEERERRHD
jgi:hypothetical protein